MKQRKAEMGVGTLIVFIAMLIVAAVAAGVLLQTSGSLQEKSLSTGQQAKSQISTHARSYEVSATNGENGSVNDFQQILKISPGSDGIKLHSSMITFSTRNATATLRFRGTDSVCEKNNLNGYGTWYDEEFGRLNVGISEIFGAGEILVGHAYGERADLQIDLDNDTQTDYVMTCGSGEAYCPAAYYDTHLMINISNFGNPLYAYVELVDEGGSTVDLTGAGAAAGFNCTDLPIVDTEGKMYGYINTWRSAGSGNDNYITPLGDADVIFEVVKAYPLDDDLDDDGSDDYFSLTNTEAIFFISSLDSITERISVALGDDISAPPANLNLAAGLITYNNTDYGYLRANGNIADADIIPKSVEFKVVPENKGEGYYAVEFDTTGSNHVPGIIQRGDVARICYESPGAIEEDSLVRITIIPKIGTATLTQFITPDVMAEEKVYLYP